MTTAVQLIRQMQTLLAQAQIAANEASVAAALVTGAAPLDSPAFTGSPTAPTAAANSDSDLLATTAYFDSQKGASNGVATLDATGHIPTAELPSSVLGGLNFLGLWDADSNTPTLTSGSGTTGDFYVVSISGTTSIDGISSWSSGDQIVFGMSTWGKVLLVTPPPTDIPLTSLANQAALTFLVNATGSAGPPSAQSVAAVTALLSAFVGAAGTAAGVKGMVPAPTADDAVLPKVLAADGTWVAPPSPDLSAYALLDSPAFIGTPIAPTVARATNSTAIATAALILLNLATAAEILPVVNGTAAQGTSTYGARVDHIHPVDTSRAPASGIPLSSLATQAALSLVGNNGTAGTATPSALTAAQAAAILPAMVGAAGTFGGTKGLVPAPGAAGTAGDRYLKEDATFGVPQGAGVQSKVINFTRDRAGANGTQAITGIGFKPTAIRFSATCDLGLSMGGVDSGLGMSCVYSEPPGGIWTGTSTYCIGIGGVDPDLPSVTGQTAVITSYDTDGFTLTWTKHGSPSSVTGQISAECLR